MSCLSLPELNAQDADDKNSTDPVLMGANLIDERATTPGPSIDTPAYHEVVERLQWAMDHIDTSLARGTDAYIAALTTLQRAQNSLAGQS